MRVAIVGAGAVGSQAAWRLAEAGAESVVFDRFVAPNPQGAHAGESRLLRTVPYLETAPGDQDIIEQALAGWQELEQRSGIRIVTACGGLIIDRPGVPALDRARSIAEAREDLEYIASAALAERYPQFAVSPAEAAVLDRQGGLADPQLAVRAALELAAAAGAELRTEQRVTRLTPRAEGIEVASDGNAAVFDQVVVAAGAWVRELLPALPVRARRLLLGWFTPRNGREELLRGMPSFVWTAEDGDFLYGGPSYDGRTVKIGIDAPWGEVADATAEGRVVSAEDSAPMRAAVERHLPWLDAAGDRFEMHVDGWSADGRGILGPLPGEDRIMLATGWSGQGFKLAPVLGSITADLARGVPVGFDIAHLDPARFA